MQLQHTSSNAWRLEETPHALPKNTGATSLNIYIQLPSQFTQKRALSWVLIALMGGAIGYQLALTRQPAIGSEFSGVITKVGFISEAHAAPNAARNMLLTSLTKPQLALPAVAPSFELHLDKTLVFDPASASQNLVHFATQAPPKPIMLAQLAPSKVVSDTVNGDSINLPEPLAEAPLKLKPALDTTAKLESKVLISKHMSADQQSGFYYQQAIAFLQQGRIAEAQDMLKKTLETYPAHEDARQTLVGLLIDNRHFDEAMPVLKAGLEISPTQTSFTQTLARLQLDSGLAEEALNTLLAGENQAQNDADYQALLAVVQQRLHHHEAAITHFQQALSYRENMPAWLIGMGVSLQMLGRNLEAKTMLTQAQQHALNPELALFVAERIKQVQSTSQ